MGIVGKTKEVREQLRLEAVRLRKEEFLSISEIASKLSISKSTASSYVKGISIPEEILQEKLDIAKEKGGILKSQVSVRVQQALMDEMLQHPMAQDLTPVQYGLLGEVFAKYKILRAGYEVFNPQELVSGCDILIRNKNGKYKRCEIKSSRDFTIKIQHNTYVEGSKHYSVGYDLESEIDFFICVLLSYERIFILPAKDFLGKRTTISFSNYTENVKFEEAYYLFDE